MTGSIDDVDTESNSRPSIRKSTFTFFGSHMIYIINTMTNQGRSAVLSQLCGFKIKILSITGGREAFSRTSFRVLTGVWVLAAMVLVNWYTGIVTSSLKTPKMKPSIDSLEELATSKEIGVVLRSDVSTGVQILVNILLLCNF
jgi:ionotropic glutamate receptor